MLSETERKQAGQVHARLRRALEAAETAQDLNRHGRDRLRARAVLSAREAMRDLRASAAEREASESSAAYRALFGIRPDRSGEDRAYRDSLAARGLTYSDARELFNQAHARGDDLAMTALAEYAWNQRGSELDGHAWVPIVEAYTGTSDARGRAISTLAGISEPGKLERLQDRMVTEIPTPSDLPGNLESLAADDQPASA